MAISYRDAADVVVEFRSNPEIYNSRKRMFSEEWAQGYDAAIRDVAAEFVRRAESLEGEGD